MRTEYPLGADEVTRCICILPAQISMEYELFLPVTDVKNYREHQINTVTAWPAFYKATAFRGARFQTESVIQTL